MAMYRSALEWILYNQGFTTGMLAKKISDLESNIAEGNAPKWASEIEPTFLIALRDIGNGAMHTNGGVIAKQKEIDTSAIELVEIVFAELLDAIYEQPLKRTQRLNKLNGIAGKLNSK